MYNYIKISVSEYVSSHVHCLFHTRRGTLFQLPSIWLRSDLSYPILTYLSYQNLYHAYPIPSYPILCHPMPWSHGSSALCEPSLSLGCRLRCWRRCWLGLPLACHHPWWLGSSRFGSYHRKSRSIYRWRGSIFGSIDRVLMLLVLATCPVEVS